MAKALTSSVLQIYLTHKLASIFQVSTELKESFHDRNSPQFLQCLAACDQVTSYVQSAQSACGPIGLAAIDRAEDILRERFNALTHSQISSELSPTGAEICYANALNRKCYGDRELEEMWLFAAKIADFARSFSLDFHPTTSCISYYGTFEKRDALMSQAKQFDAKQRVAALTGESPIARLLARAAHLCRYAVVCARIGELHQNFSRALATTAHAVDAVMLNQYRAAAESAAALEKAVQYATSAETETCAKVRALFLLAVQLTERGVDIKAPKSLLAEEAPMYEQHVAFADLQFHAAVVAELATALSPVVAQIAAFRAKAAARSSDPPPVALEAAEMIETIFTEINAFDEGSVGAACNREKARWMLTISQVVDKLNPTLRLSSPEERFIQRCQGMAEAMSKRSFASSSSSAAAAAVGCTPAHPYMAECWQRAAVHMRSALDARAELEAKVDPTMRRWSAVSQRVEDLQACAKEYERAAGTFSEAAGCYAKSEHCFSSGKSQAAQLWREAADALVQAGLIPMKRVEEAVASQRYQPDFISVNEVEQSLRGSATACVACAKYMEGLSTDCVERTSTTLPYVKIVASTTAAVTGEIDRVLQMRLLLVVHLERTAVENASAQASKRAETNIFYLSEKSPGEEVTMQKRLRGLITNVIVTLRAEQEQVVASLPERHVLHKNAPSAEIALRCGQLREWVYGMVLKHFDLYLRILQATQQQQQQLQIQNKECRIITPELLKRAQQGLVSGVASADIVCVYASFPDGVTSVRDRGGWYGVSAQDNVAAMEARRCDLQQVSCARHLAAVQAALAGQFIPSALFTIAAQQISSVREHSEERSMWCRGVVGNELVRRACQLPNTAVVTSADSPPAALLVHVVDSFAEVAADAQRVAEVVHAHVQRIHHQNALHGGEIKQDSHLLDLHQKAADQYGFLVDYSLAVFYSTDANASPQQRDKDGDNAVRAGQAARWYALAIEATVAGRKEVANLYGHAAGYVFASAQEFKEYTGFNDEEVDDKMAFAISDKAAERFAEAARALLAGDTPLFKRWMLAAQQTAQLVDVSSYSKKRSVYRSMNFSKAALADADARAAQALAWQARHPQKSTKSARLKEQKSEARSSGKSAANAGAEAENTTPAPAGKAADEEDAGVVSSSAAVASSNAGKRKREE